MGNVFLRARRWSGARVANLLDELALLLPVLRPEASLVRLAAELAETHQLTFYDALYAAVARERGFVLATDDRALIDSGLGEQAGVIAGRLGLDAV